MSVERGMIGNIIRNARTEKGMTQAQLAEIVNVSENHLKHVEGGYRNPSVDLLINIAQILNISVDNIIFPQKPENEALLVEMNASVSDFDSHEMRLVLGLISTINREKA